MTTIGQLAVQVLQKLEENITTPIFWDLQFEVFPILVEAMNDASLLTGTVQVSQSALLTIPANSTFITMPQNVVALLRIAGPTAVKKTDVYSLDQIMPGWEAMGGASANPPVQQIQYWFPVGLNQFGVFPQLTVPQNVQIDYLAYPVTVPTPYTGNEPVPFQLEFQDALIDYAAHVLRLKESGYEFQASQAVYQDFLDTMRALTAFQSRHDSLVFNTATGARVRVNPVEVR